MPWTQAPLLLKKQLSIWTCIWNSHTVVYFSRVIPICTCKLSLNESSINLVGDITKWFGVTAPQIAHSPPSFSIFISKTTEGKSSKFSIKYLKYVEADYVSFRDGRTYGKQNYRVGDREVDIWSPDVAEIFLCFSLTSARFLLPTHPPSHRHRRRISGNKAARPWRWSITCIYYRYWEYLQPYGHSHTVLK